MTIRILLCCLLALSLRVAATAADDGGAADLLEIVAGSDDVEVQRGVLLGIAEGLAGRRRAAMPAPWAALQPKLAASPDAQVRAQAEELAALYGDAAAIARLRALARAADAAAADRLRALAVLLRIHHADLPGDLRALLADQALRGAALRGLADYADPAAPAAILALYPGLPAGERRDALSTLAARVPYAQALAAAVEAGQVPVADLTPFVVRQLGMLGDEALAAFATRIAAAWTGRTPADEITRYKTLVTAEFLAGADAGHGRALFARTCQQCHLLFGEGGAVGPDLTGSNRADLDYVLQNVIDPSAIVGVDYQLAVVRCTDGRVITGMVRETNPSYLVVENESVRLTLPQDEVAEIGETAISVMPDGLFARLSPTELRDLLTYLKSPTQVDAAK